MTIHTLPVRVVKERGATADMRIMAERRSEPRVLCADIVHVNWIENGKARRATALLEDISPAGACLQLETAVGVGSAIRWETPNQRFSGVVRYCSYQEIGYFVGVEFEAGARWSKQTYEPAHLLELERLISGNQE